MSLKSIFDMCQALHRHITRSSNELFNNEVDTYVKALRSKLRKWEPSKPLTRRYDNSVREMIMAVLEEYELNKKVTVVVTTTRTFEVSLRESAEALRLRSSDISDAEIDEYLIDQASNVEPVSEVTVTYCGENGEPFNEAVWKIIREYDLNNTSF